MTNQERREEENMSQDGWITLRNDRGEDVEILRETIVGLEPRKDGRGTLVHLDPGRFIVVESKAGTILKALLE